MSQTKAQLIQPIGIVTAGGVVVTGVLTASSFDGEVVGSATSIISGSNLNVGIISATNFSGDFTGTATGIKTGADIKVGSFTATSFTGDFTGTATSMMRGTGFEAGAVNATGFEANVTGDVTGNATGLAGSVTSGGNIHIGVMTATSYSGDGSNLIGIAATNYNTQVVAASSFSINVTASDSSNYTLSGNDRNGSVSGSDPTVTIEVGDTVNFVVSASGHPFYLRVSDGGANVGGATNQGTQSGTVSWTPNTAGTYYYQCGNHASMLGTITVNDTRTIDLSAGNMITFNQTSSTTVAFANTSTAMDVTLVRKVGGTYNISYSTGGVDFDGNDYLSIPDDTDFDFATGDFTIEFWMYLASNSSSNPVLIGADGGWYIQTKSSDSVLSFSYGGSVEYLSASTSLSTGDWHHIAAARSGTSFKLFVDGVTRISQTTSDNINLANALNIGRYGADSLYFTGKLSNVRIVKGTAVYTSDFVPPSGALNNISGTVLLCCQDASSATASVVTPGTITATGDPTAGAQTVALSGTAPSASLNITWPSSVRWNGGTAPTLLSGGEDAEDTQQFQLLTRDSGVTWYGWTNSSYDAPYQELWAWGRNNNGGSGQNDTTERSSPVQIPGVWNKATAFTDVVMATKKDGALWVWGGNWRGRLGLNEPQTTDYSSPVQLGSDTTWSNVTGGSNATLAIKTDGTLWSWGYNYVGMLGQNSTEQKSSPTQVGTQTTWSQTTGQSHKYGIKTDGTLWSWGYNNVGGLGQNDLVNRSSPTQVGTGTDWSMISTGHRQTAMAIKTDGAMWGWGSANNKILNSSDNNAKSSPVQIPGTWKSVYQYSEGIYAFKQDSTMWAWGANEFGQLGQNSPTVYSSPRQIPGTNWSGDALCGPNFIFTTKTDGTLWAWGSNDEGQFAQNNIVKLSSPTQIPGTTWDYSKIYYGSWLGCDMAIGLKST